MSEIPRKTTHFGYRNVPEDEKPEMVQEVFSSVSRRYDLMNDVMSLGVHRIWKDALVDWLAPRSRQRILDVAGGTGDVAFRIVRRAPGVNVTVLDSNEDMLAEGQKRNVNAEGGESVSWVRGDAMAIPFPDRQFDACVVSFGIRNFSRIPETLDEMFRVIKMGGRLLVLEFGQIRNPGMRQLYDNYSFRLIPRIGEFVTGDRDSYQYLVESIRKFPGQDRFAGMMQQAGFQNVKYRSFTFGIVFIHSGWKI